MSGGRINNSLSSSRPQFLRFWLFVVQQSPVSSSGGDPVRARTGDCNIPGCVYPHSATLLCSAYHNYTPQPGGRERESEKEKERKSERGGLGVDRERQKGGIEDERERWNLDERWKRESHSV